jgi:hypothetical protein
MYIPDMWRAIKLPNVRVAVQDCAMRELKNCFDEFLVNQIGYETVRER